MCAKFEGNLIRRLYFMAVFCKCANRRKKKEKKNKENEQLYEGLYLRNGYFVLSPDMPAPAQQIWSYLVKRTRSYERA